MCSGSFRLCFGILDGVFHRCGHQSCSRDGSRLREVLSWHQSRFAATCSVRLVGTDVVVVDSFDRWYAPCKICRSGTLLYVRQCTTTFPTLRALLRWQGRCLRDASHARLILHSECTYLTTFTCNLPAAKLPVVDGLLPSSQVPRASASRFASD